MESTSNIYRFNFILKDIKTNSFNFKASLLDAIPNIYQFKITLKGTKPKIWRRIQVPEEYNFWELHAVIQDAMGWKDYHSHQFEFKKSGAKIRIGTPSESNDDDTIPEKTVKIKDYFSLPTSKANYEYDFVDGWKHKVRLEKIFSVTSGIQYPQCTAGKLACPPEGCGGVHGYEDLLKIVANPKHEEFAEKMEWLERTAENCVGGTYNPEYFDPKLVNFCMAIMAYILPHQVKQKLPINNHTQVKQKSPINNRAEVKQKLPINNRAQVKQKSPINNRAQVKQKLPINNRAKVDKNEISVEIIIEMGIFMAMWAIFVWLIGVQ